jgi:hypothetical protein
MNDWLRLGRLKRPIQHTKIAPAEVRVEITRRPVLGSGLLHHFETATVLK